MAQMIDTLERTSNKWKGSMTKLIHTGEGASNKSEGSMAQMIARVSREKHANRNQDRAGQAAKYIDYDWNWNKKMKNSTKIK